MSVVAHVRPELPMSQGIATLVLLVGVVVLAIIAYDAYRR